MKYIMLRVNTGDVGKLVPVIFPDFICHSDMDKIVKELLTNTHNLKNPTTYSAGEIDIEQCNCYGESSTLNEISQEDDSFTIRTYDYLHGIVE